MGSKKEEGMTADQVHELIGWAKRLTNEQYQLRRGLFRKATNPDAIIGEGLGHPFRTPLHKGLRLKTEGPECAESIDVGSLEFFQGDVVCAELQRGKSLGDMGLLRFGQYHAEHLIARADELPDFPDRTEIVFPATVYVTADGNNIEFFPCITCYSTGWLIELVAQSEAFRPSCRFPYHLNTLR